MDVVIIGQFNCCMDEWYLGSRKFKTIEVATKCSLVISLIRTVCVLERLTWRYNDVA